MSDETFLTTDANFDESLNVAIRKLLQATLRGGLGYMPAGSIIPLTTVKGQGPGDAPEMRSFQFADLSESSGGSIEDGQSDPDTQQLAMDFVSVTGTRWADLVSWSRLAEERSPFPVPGVAGEKLAFRALVELDNLCRALYAAEAADVFSGTGNTQNVEVTGADIIAVEDILDAVAIARAANLEPTHDGQFVLVMHPFVFRDLQTDSKYRTDVQYAAPERILRGWDGHWAGNFGGAYIYTTSRAIVKTDAGQSSNDVYISTLIAADALFAGDPASVRGGMVRGADKSDPLDRQHLATIELTKGGVLNDPGDGVNRFVQIASGASLGSQS